MGFHIANPLRDRELLELARREAFALADAPERTSELRTVITALPEHWQRRYHLARIG
jgi:ATP-dependent DNA helicase RecG